MTAIPIADYAMLTGKNRGTIAKLLRDAGYQHGERGAKLYESKDALPIIYAVASADDLDLQQERARVSFHQANKAALEEKTLAGELAVMSEVEAEWTERTAAARAKLLSLPIKLAGALHGIEDKNQIKDAALLIIHEALQELSEYDIEAARAAATAAEQQAAESKKQDKARATKARRKPAAKRKPRAKKVGATANAKRKPVG